MNIENGDDAEKKIQQATVDSTLACARWINWEIDSVVLVIFFLSKNR